MLSGKVSVLLLHVADHADLLIKMAKRVLRGSTFCLVCNKGVKGSGAKSMHGDAVGEELAIHRTNLSLQLLLKELLLTVKPGTR